MKFGIFMLTRNEQRVVILALLVLLATAFVRYRYNVKSFPPNKARESPAMTTALPLDDDSRDSDDAEQASPRELPLPQSSP